MYRKRYRHSHVAATARREQLARAEGAQAEAERDLQRLQDQRRLTERVAANLHDNHAAARALVAQTEAGLERQLVQVCVRPYFLCPLLGGDRLVLKVPGWQGWRCAILVHE